MRRTRICQLDSCDKVIKAGTAKYCGAHRYRLARYGDPYKLHVTSGQGETREERFWSKVAITANPDKCWEWQGTMQKNRKEHYGVTSMDGRQWLAHRLSWFYWHKQPPDPDLMILHTCDNPRCVNPSHLEDGTHKDNMRGMRERNRAPRGEDRPNAVLTEMIVRQIWQLKNEGLGRYRIARQIGIKDSLVKSVLARKAWTHVVI